MLTPSGMSSSLGGWKLHHKMINWSYCFQSLQQWPSNHSIKNVDGQSTMRNLVIIVEPRGCSPTVTTSLIVPLGITWSRVNPKRGEVIGLSLLSVRPILLYVSRYIMSTTLPLFTIILWTLLLVTFAVITDASLWGWYTYLAFASVKTMSSSSCRAPFTGRSSILCTYVRGVLRASLAHLSHAFQLSPATCGPPKIVRTSLILYGLHYCGRSFVVATWGSFSKSSLKCPSRINLSISFLRALHFTVLYPISLWYA